MAFKPQVFTDIFDKMFNYIQDNTELDDAEIGAVARTIVEAVALELDEQYFQQTQILDDFSIDKASGTGLDRRVADANVFRQDEKAATGTLFIVDKNLKKTTVFTNVSSGSTSVIVASVSALPGAGSLPYTIRIGEGTTNVEDVTVTAINTLTNTLTINGTLYSHSVGELVSYKDGSPDKLIPAGIQVQTLAINGAQPVSYVTTTSGTILNGNYYSSRIRATCTIPGVTGNIGKQKIKEFTSSTPFNGAGVINLTAFAGGTEQQSDSDLKEAYRAKLQSLSNGIPLALQQAALGVEDPVTKQSVISSSVKEDFDNGIVTVYIDDGSGFNPDKVALSRTNLSSSYSSGVSSINGTTTTISSFPGQGYILISPEDSAQAEVKKYNSVSYTTAAFTLDTATAYAHNINDEILYVDMICNNNLEDGRKIFNLSFSPIEENSYKVYVGYGTTPNTLGNGYTLQVEGTDYILNRGTGQLEFINSGIGLNGFVVVSYTYFTGLVSTVQTVINGTLLDPINFPGVRAAGIKVYVDTPDLRRITVICSITPENGATLSELVVLAKQTLENYILSLGIGNDFILAEAIKRVKEINGVYNVQFSSPTSDIAILSDELPSPFDSSGNSLITVL